MTAPAYADASQTKVTVKKGDTVYGICQSLGLDYNICKNTIMRLNGMEKGVRAQLHQGRLHADLPGFLKELRRERRQERG